jgi:TRAP-type C4-dicarboxylate transport system permease small subunit
LINSAASSAKKFVGTVTGNFAKIGIGAFVLLVGILIYSVIARKAGYPLKGVIELSEFGMALVTFLFMSENYFKADQMTMDTFVEKVPKKGRTIINAFVHLVNFIILGLMSWQLFAYGIMVQGMGQTSVNLRIPVPPFIFIAAACSVLLTAVYLVHFLNSLVKITEAWRT